MTDKEQQLLLRVLCEMLPYGTICEDIYGNSGILFDLTPELNSVTLKISELGSTWTTDVDKVKPYLRPMSNMTDDERRELSGLTNDKFKFYLYTRKPEIICYEKYNYLEGLKIFDWLNEHHFDYRGLIEKGLALEATEGMYNLKNK